MTCWATSVTEVIASCALLPRPSMPRDASSGAQYPAWCRIWQIKNMIRLVRTRSMQRARMTCRVYLTSTLSGSRQLNLL